MDEVVFRTTDVDRWCFSWLNLIRSKSDLITPDVNNAAIMLRAGSIVWSWVKNGKRGRIYSLIACLTSRLKLSCDRVNRDIDVSGFR